MLAQKITNRKTEARPKEGEAKLRAAQAYAERGWYIFPVHVPIFDADGVCIGCSCEHYKRSEEWHETLKKQGEESKFNPKFKCDSPGKCPAVRWRDKSTNDPATVGKWWGHQWKTVNVETGEEFRFWPNIGLDCGASHILALDDDAYKQVHGDLADWLSPDETDTVTQLSGSHEGSHILWSMNGEGYGNEEGTLPPGINIRGDGGYIVLTPSLHKSGNCYEWINDPAETELKPIPAPVKTVLDEAQAATRPAQFSDVTTEKPDLKRWKISKETRKGIESPAPDRDRSATDQSAILALIYAGASDDDIRAVFEHYPIGTEGKFAERGLEYLARSIGNARQYAEEHPREAEATKRAGGYEVRHGRIGRVEEQEKTDPDTGETYTVEVFHPYCNFDAWIVADVAADDGEEISRKIVLAGKLESGRDLPEIEIDAANYEQMNWVVARWGARCNIVPKCGGVLRSAIQALSEETLIDERCYTYTGWTHINGERVFLHGNGALGAEGVNVKLPANLKNYVFPTDDAIDPVTAMRESIKLMDIAPLAVSGPLWAAMYLAPLAEIILPAFTLSVEGESGSLKSSYTALMLNHYGPGFDEYAMPADWLGTANSLERLCFHAKDTPLVIDDFRPSTDPKENAQMLASVSRITRAVGNRQGRSRLTGDSEFQRTYPPRGVVLMTAERKAMGKSTAARIITLAVEKGQINKRLLSDAQDQRHVYGYAMRGYILSVRENYAGLANLLPAQVAEVRNADGQSGQHLRLPNATAILYAAFDCALNYAVTIGVITPSEAQKRCADFRLVLQALAAEQSEATEAENPARKYMTIIATLLATDRAYLTGKGAQANIGNAMAEKLGWHDGNRAYLLPNAYNTVCKYAAAEGWHFPSDENTLRNELYQAGYLIKTDEKRLTRLQRVPGESANRQHVIVLDRAKLMELLTSMGYESAEPTD